MPGAQFLAHFGLYVREQFLPETLCARLRAESRLADSRPATVTNGDGAYEVDEATRRTRIAEVSEASLVQVQNRLLTLRPELERHFDVSTTSVGLPHLLVYQPGDYFHAHADNSGRQNAPAAVAERRISVVIFLNEETAEPRPDAYVGGALTFYGIWDDPRMRDRGIPLLGETGLLVAFRSNLLHEVTPVLHGERFTLVTWLCN